ncbi:MAG: DUF5698 domain-containing protein [Actinobacteria bacterium]|nr:DUF5698 domain-containing protein [Actinomycetota bacterium]
MDVTLGTIRINFIVRRRKFIAAAIGFFEVTIFVAVIARVIQDLNNNIYGIFAYGAGFAAGTLIGITISDKLSRDLISTNIISKNKADEIEECLRKEGFGATCYKGFGREGDVKIINVVCRQTHFSRLNKIISGIDPETFVASHTLENLRGGFMYGLKKK